MQKQILQLIPAPEGMVAEWKKRKKYSFLPVVSLALVAYESGENSIDGVVCTGDKFELCRDIKGFQGFCLSGMPISSFLLEDQGRRERLEEFISQKCEREGILDEEPYYEEEEEPEEGDESEESEEMNMELVEMEELLLMKNEGEFANIALAVDCGDLPLAQISSALHRGDLGELVKIKQGLREKLKQGRCPICGKWSSQLLDQ